MTKEIVKINGADYGLTDKTAQQISNTFKPMLDKMVELENEFNKIVNQKRTPETIEAASELLKKYVKVRTGTAEIHQRLKRFYLQGGRFVDGWKNAQIMASQDKEEKLQEIKNHFENLEKQRIQDLHDKREKELRPFMGEMVIIPGSLGEMSDQMWDNYLTGARVNFEQQKAAEEKAEYDRLLAAQKEAERLAKIEAENKRLQAEAKARQEKLDKRKPMMAGLWDYLPEKYTNKDIELELSDKEFAKVVKEATKAKNKAVEIAKKKAEAEAKAQAEQKRLQAEQAKKMEAARKAADEAQAKMKKLQEEKEAEAKKLQEEKEAEAKKLQEEKEAEAKKGDADKIKDLISDLEKLKTKYTFKAKANQVIYKNTVALIDKIVNYVNEKTS